MTMHTATGPGLPLLACVGGLLAGAIVAALTCVAYLISKGNCCPHPELGDDPDNAVLPADTTNAGYRGSTA